MRAFRNPGHTISSFLAPIPQKPNNTDWRRNGLAQNRLKTAVQDWSYKSDEIQKYGFCCEMYDFVSEVVSEWR